MTSQFSHGESGDAAESTGNGAYTELALRDLPMSNIFTSSLPPDPEFKTPSESDKASREDLGPRMVKGALYTYVRPEKTESAELLGVSQTGMRDLGLRLGEEKTQDFKQLMAGNRIVWDEETKTGIYPWAQCYGGWQFGSWAGQLGDGRAISLFETTNPSTRTRYELQLKGAGKTPYSRFADGKAVLRSSIREFIVSEVALNALRIPTTRALALTLTPKSRVRREWLEPGAIVARFAQSWIRIGTFDILRARGDRALIRTLATYVAEHVFAGWLSLPSHLDSSQPIASTAINPPRSIPASTSQGPADIEENRFTRLYREIARRNAVTVASWQAYAFTNGVLNTDNTSILGLSLDFGPFAFLDNFDPSYTPNHDDHALRYSYQNQPSIIWWNLVRLGESLGELIGAGSSVDDDSFVKDGVSENFAPTLIKRAQTVIPRVGEEFKAVFLAEYTRLMRARLGLISESESDFDSLFSGLLDVLEALELDFNHFFRRLSSVKLADLETESQRQGIASIFFHAEGITPPNITESVARTRVASWLLRWRDRVSIDWASRGETGDAEREAAMKRVNPKFIPRSWVLDEVIQRVEKGGERDVLGRLMNMAEKPFAEDWSGDSEEEERWCGDVPREGRGLMCSCSS
ncbi:hypothetical protein MMC07_004269 [Pseudocyphellaria aurata]|nr:hypothetical protein [Pseudocyphellaria aurata]